MLKDFGRLCKSDWISDSLTRDDLRIICALRDRVASARPIQITANFLETWYIFTDGACETNENGEKVGGVGGVLISSCGRYLQHFGANVPGDIMQLLLKHSDHPVHELEVMPVLISFLLWKSFIAKGQVMHYSDNDSCRFALMKGVGETPIARCLVDSILRLENSSQTKSWYSRVPSHSNVSDDPSRGSFQALNAVGSIKMEVPWAVVTSMLPSL